MEEAEMLQKIIRRRPRALEQVIDQYGAYVATVVGNVLGGAGTREDVEELAADVFFSLWEHAQTVMPGKLKPWLGAVSRNRARDFLRKVKPVLPMEEDVLTIPTDSPEQHALAAAQRRELLDAVEAMPEPDREIFLRYYYLYETMEAIALRMGLPLGTIKSKLHRGRKILRDRLTEQEVERWS